MALFDFGAISAYKFAGSNAIEANTNANSLAIDTQGFEGVAVVSAVAASTLNAATSLTVSLEFLEGNDTNISNASPLDAKSVVFNPDLETSNIAYWASVRPVKRYLFAKYVPTTNATANVVTVGALGFPANAPTQ
jgi:hypothetical protein